MQYNYYYLINYGKNEVVVLSESSTKAIELWINHKNDERERDNLSRSFEPSNFSIKEISREDLVIKASD